MEYSNFGQFRKSSNISEDIDISDLEHCILCYNNLQYFQLGKCDHKNICNVCSLRLRLIIKDKQCSICKTQLDEIFITDNKDLTFEQFQSELKGNVPFDKDEPNIFYDNAKAKSSCFKLRSLQCLMQNCNPGQQFKNSQALKNHLETEHQKTFCKICLKGRLIFIREQRIYNLKHLTNHIEYGDAGNERQAEILPHPWCDFCQEYFFNDQVFFDHLSRHHLTCHLCGETYKNVYYAQYSNLENHFAWTHHLCPYEICKARCYVAFRTEDELKTHLDIEHRSKESKIKANALLNFEFDAKNEKKRKYEKTEIKDSEGVDFSFYFSEKYNFINDKRKYQNNYYNKKFQKESLDKSDDKTLKQQRTPENKLSLMFSFLSKYIQDILQNNQDFQNQEFKYSKSQLYQMYFVIAKLDALRLSKLDFLINFGITMREKHLILNEMENGQSYEIVQKTFDLISFIQILKICKYFNWADKKLHAVFYIEKKDDISEDLLDDFRDSDSKSKFSKPKQLSKQQMTDKNQNENVIVKEGGMLSEHDYLFGSNKHTNKQIIDTKSQMDFPSLEIEAQQKKAKIKQQQTIVLHQEETNDWDRVDPFKQNQSQNQNIIKMQKKESTKKDHFPELPFEKKQSDHNLDKKQFDNNLEEKKEDNVEEESKENKQEEEKQEQKVQQSKGGKKGGRKRKNKAAELKGGFY